MFDESYEYYAKTLICTHGWSLKSSKSKRSNHDVRSTTCQARINVTLQLNQDCNYSVKINKHFAQRTTIE